MCIRDSIDMDSTKTARNPSTNELLLLLNECNMQNFITSHTRIIVHSKTLIDLAITGNPSKITNSGAHATGISDHDFIYISINLFRQKAQPKLIYVRNYNNIYIDQVRQDLERTPWHIIELFDNVNDAL